MRRRQLDRQRYPDRFEHIWCGDYAKAFDGAYYASVLVDARREGRFCELKADPILPIKLFWDIGGAGAKPTPARFGFVSLLARRFESSTTSKAKARC